MFATSFADFFRFSQELNKQAPKLPVSVINSYQDINVDKIPNSPAHTSNFIYSASSQGLPILSCNEAVDFMRECVPESIYDLISSSCSFSFEQVRILQLQQKFFLQERFRHSILKVLEQLRLKSTKPSALVDCWESLCVKVRVGERLSRSEKVALLLRTGGKALGEHKVSEDKFAQLVTALLKMNRSKQKDPFAVIHLASNWAYPHHNKADSQTIGTSVAEFLNSCQKIVELHGPGLMSVINSCLKGRMLDSTVDWDLFQHYYKTRKALLEADANNHQATSDPFGDLSSRTVKIVEDFYNGDRRNNLAEANLHFVGSSATDFISHCKKLAESFTPALDVTIATAQETKGEILPEFSWMDFLSFFKKELGETEDRQRSLSISNPFANFYDRTEKLVQLYQTSTAKKAKKPIKEIVRTAMSHFYSTRYLERCKKVARKQAKWLLQPRNLFPPKPQDDLDYLIKHWDIFFKFYTEELKAMKVNASTEPFCQFLQQTHLIAQKFVQEKTYEKIVERANRVGNRFLRGQHQMKLDRPQNLRVLLEDNHVLHARASVYETTKLFCKTSAKDAEVPFNDELLLLGEFHEEKVLLPNGECGSSPGSEGTDPESARLPKLPVIKGRMSLVRSPSIGPREPPVSSAVDSRIHKLQQRRIKLIFPPRHSDSVVESIQIIQTSTRKVSKSELEQIVSRLSHPVERTSKSRSKAYKDLQRKIRKENKRKSISHADMLSLVNRLSEIPQHKRDSYNSDPVNFDLLLRKYHSDK